MAQEPDPYQMHQDVLTAMRQQPAAAAPMPNQARTTSQLYSTAPADAEAPAAVAGGAAAAAVEGSFITGLFGALLTLIWFILKWTVIGLVLLIPWMFKIALSPFIHLGLDNRRVVRVDRWGNRID